MVCVTGAGAGVESVWEQKKLEARKMLQTPTRQMHALLGNLPTYQNDGRKKTPLPTRPTFTHNFDFGNTKT